LKKLGFGAQEKIKQVALSSGYPDSSASSQRRHSRMPLSGIHHDSNGNGFPPNGSREWRRGDFAAIRSKLDSRSFIISRLCGFAS